MSPAATTVVVVTAALDPVRVAGVAVRATARSPAARRVAGTRALSTHVRTQTG
jgi:hypothetical protein